LAARAELDPLRVVLVRTRNPLNLGAAARAMSNFGFAHLRVVQPYDPAFREARSAVGASRVLADAEEFATVGEAVADCSLVVGTTVATRRDMRHKIHTLADGARMIRKRIGSGLVALLFGSEKTGLSNQEMSHCDWLLRIPTREEHGSMNLGQAVAVCVYELARDNRGRVARAKEKDSPAKAGDTERVVALLMEALRASGSLQTRSALTTEERVRRMIHRHKLSTVDAEFWLGVLRQITWKLSAKKDEKTQRGAV
jgi:TrmH family RNA methyltransferase